MTGFSDLVGFTLTAVRNVNDEELIFETNQGVTFRLYHDQTCCETVAVESITGDLGDLIGTPILMAEVAESCDDPPGYAHKYQPESQTWTFYKLRTIRGSVDIRWHGTSNGYYSESVSFCRDDP